MDSLLLNVTLLAEHGVASPGSLSISLDSVTIQLNNNALIATITFKVYLKLIKFFLMFASKA
jgi:hypothetical protein